MATRHRDERGPHRHDGRHGPRRRDDHGARGRGRFRHRHRGDLERHGCDARVVRRARQSALVRRPAQHGAARNAESPLFATHCSADLKANGGKGSIAEQIAASRIDIVLGGGLRYFAQPAEGEATKTVRDLAADERLSRHRHRRRARGADARRQGARAVRAGHDARAVARRRRRARPSACSTTTSGPSCARAVRVRAEPRVRRDADACRRWRARRSRISTTGARSCS